MKKATIAGAGLVGSLWAILLAKRGYEVTVYEGREDMRKSGVAGGRSINLAMSDRGWRAIREAGIEEQIRQVAIPMHGRMMHSPSGELTFQPYGREGQAIYSVSRAGLNMALLDIAEQLPGVELCFGHRGHKLDVRRKVLTVEQSATGQRLEVPAPLVFGADGAFSAIRGSMQRLPRFNYSQTYLEYGYKELNVPPLADGTHAMDAHALHIWPRGKFMLIALPNTDGSFTCTLFLPFEGDVSFERLGTDEAVMGFFETYFSDAIPVMPALLEDFHSNPTAALVTVRCSPWHHGGSAVLMGDAAHAIVPFYGQGMNAGFEDCTVLNEMATEYGDDWEKILPAFTERRAKDGAAVADLALRNFIEMRDLVADPLFLLRKQMEAHFATAYPGRFLPLYTMVTFSDLPYSTALAEGEAQDELFARLMKIEGIADNWQDNAQVREVFEAWLAERGM